MEFDLNKMKKEGMFHVPKDYFESLPDRIDDSIKAEEHTHSKIGKKPRKLWSALLVAASIIGFMMIGYYSINFLITNRGESMISSNNAIEYINFYSEDFDESFILENIIETNDNEKDIDDSSETLIYFLINEGIDEFTLYKEL